MTLSVGQILAVQVLGCSPMSQIAGDRLTVGLDGHIGQLVQLGDKRGAVFRESRDRRGYLARPG